MQKLDFVRNLEELVNKLQSQSIVDRFKAGFNSPGNNYQYDQITPLLFQSKSNYDQMHLRPEYSVILNSLGASSIYDEKNLSSLTKILRAGKAQIIIPQANAVALYNFHNTLISTWKLSKEVLMSDIMKAGYEVSLDNGVLVLQIVIEEDGLETDKYIKIFTSLKELVETLSVIYGEQENSSEIVLLDSGSDTNLGIKSGIESAKSLFLIFKEVWDFITTYKHLKREKENNTLIDSLSVRAEILRQKEEGIITEEEAKKYIHLVKTRTEDLIGMKVLPKQIVAESNTVENKKLLEEFEGVKLIRGDEDTNKKN